MRGVNKLRNPLVMRAKTLRENLTEAEKHLWKFLRAKQLGGWKFRRQHPIGNFIVDFVCIKRKLVVEIDGGQHAVERRKDRERDLEIERQGYNVLRFWNNEVLQKTRSVLETIKKNCDMHPPLTPPSREGKFGMPPPSREGKFGIPPPSREGD